MKRKSDLIMQNVGGENILVPIGAQVLNLNGLILLNNTAACTWEMLNEERSLDELATALAKRFNVTVEIAHADLRAFVDELSSLGLLEQ